jgi:type IV pilus assembly protein PilC
MPTLKKAAPPIARPQGFDPLADRAAGGAREKTGKLRGRVGSAALSNFTTQLAVLQSSGLPLVRSLRILAGQMKPGLLKATVSRVREDVEGGTSLSEALSKHPKVFDSLYVNMVKAGEAGGALDTILNRLAGFMEKAQALRSQIRSASIYPAVVFSLAMLVLFVVMTLVVPKFQEFLKDLGQDMPALTVAVLKTSEFLRSYWYVFLLLPIVAWAGLHFFGKTARGRFLLDKARLKVPLFGPILHKNIIARFCRTLATLLSSGVPILESFAIVKASIGNRVVEKAIEDVRTSVREGEGIARPLGESGLFDDLIVNMVDVGEKTGELDKMLSRIGESYESQVDRLVKGFVSVLEPLLIIVIGGVVLVIILSIFQPLIKLMESLQSR